MNFPYPFFPSSQSRLLLVLLATPGALLAQTVPPPPPASALSAPATAADAPILLPTVEVIATAEKNPLAVSFDPKAPVQPIPAHDGADALKTIPGVSVIRKGGIDGDPTFRGMAGSRLGVLLDGQTILGGCGSRMDPPTAYDFPAAYDKVTLRKGPHTVLAGPGNSAGVVLFEHSPRTFCHPTADVHGALTLGSFGRNDQAVDLAAGAPLGYLTTSANRSESADYEDGQGRSVHSAYSRWSTQAALGWTPTENTLVELSGARSDGEAAYADRPMDGVKFDRDNLALRFCQKAISDTVQAIDAQLYYNYVDHVMDNFSLRPITGPAAVSNPDRKTVGGKLSATLTPTDSLETTLGADFQSNDHTLRSTPNFANLPRVKDSAFDQVGLFGEATQHLDTKNRLIGGARLDAWEAEKTVARLHRDDTLPSGFARYERDFGTSTAYLGLGHTERFPDYWEIIGAGKPNAVFGTEAEKTTQLDTGVITSHGPLKTSLSLFASTVEDFILIQPALAATPTRNVAARTYGGEASVEYAFASGWTATTSLAYVRGTNETDDRPLAQMPPLEGRLGLNYATKTWTAGGLLRLVAEQNRVAVGQGNIVGQDLGSTPGFVVFSLNGGYQLTAYAKLSVGVDNLLDATYAEHISRGGAAVAGYTTSTRINEPGATYWLKLDLSY